MIWHITASHANLRLDHFVAQSVGCSHAEARRLIEEKTIRLHGGALRKGTRLAEGMRVEWAGNWAASATPIPEPERPLHLLFTDTGLLGIDKPAGEPTHPLRPGERGTLANALVARYPECALASTDSREAGLCHRLDRFTSGAILAARNLELWHQIRKLFGSHAVEKTYLALVDGKPPAKNEIVVPLRQQGTRAVADATGHRQALAAETRFVVLAQGPSRALVRAVSTTGRMHQIRAHLAWVGHPLCGDELYGNSPALSTERPHFLHASSLGLVHPLTQQELRIKAALRPDVRDQLAILLNLPPSLWQQNEIEL